MRVSDASAYERANHYVRTSKHNLEKAQAQVGSLKRINKPSDDPVGMVELLKLRGMKNKLVEAGKNQSSAKAFMEITDSALAQVQDLLIRGKELALQQAGDVGTTYITRRSVAEEVGQLQQQLFRIGNSKLAGRYIFAGYRTDNQAFDLDGFYNGDNGEIEIEIAEETMLPINLPGNTVFLGENLPNGELGVNMFDVLKRLEVGLLTNNKALVQETIDGFDKAMDQNLLNRARLGARLNSLSRLQETSTSKSINVADLISLKEDADVYKAFSDLTKNENVLNTTLAASSKLIQPSLLNFMR